MEDDKVVTPEGATTEEKSLASGFHDRRAEMLEVIAKRVESDFDEKIKADAIIMATPGTPPDDHMTETPKEEPVAEVVPEPKKVKLTIYGQEKEVTEDEVIEAGKRALQKIGAADKTLEEASKLKKEVEQLREHIMRSPSQDRTVDPPKQDANIQQWVSAIRYGTEEEATQAFQQALEAMKPKADQIDSRQVGQIVDQRLSQAQIVQRFSAPPEAGGFGDLVTDPYLFQIATIEAEKLLQSGAPNSWDTYVEAGRKTREWRDRAMGKPISQPEPVNEKAERKKSIDAIPSASARTVTGNKEPEREPTPSEVIEQMRRSRVGGQ
jgi:hypothetical protein